MRINLIPMAGAGARFANEGYRLPKPLIPVSGKPMILQAAHSLPEADKWIFVCRKEHLEQSPQLRDTLTENFPDPTIIDIDYLTEGQASTCLLAEKYIDPEGTLMIGACDNGMLWNREKFQELVDDTSVDALIFTFRNNVTVQRNPKAYGWVKVDDANNVLGMSVKIPISENPINDHAVVGSFWFRRGKDFISKTNQMIAKNRRINGEFYVDKLFDELIEDGMKVKVFEIDQYICWGTPNDLRTYEYWEKFFTKSDHLHHA